MKEKIITTSWDDGHPLDLKLMRLLNKYRIPGTFYIPASNAENPVLKETEIKNISTDFEIGSHTYGHKRLDKISDSEAHGEISKGKEWLENLLSKEITGFCYPGGKYNRSTKKILENCGIKYARTVELLSTDLKDRLYAPTSVQLVPHGTLNIIGNLVKRRRGASLTDFLFSYKFETDPGRLTGLMLREVDRNGGIFHLWGHSWEIEKFNLWDETEKLFRYLSGRKDFIYCFNSELEKYAR